MLRCLHSEGERRAGEGAGGVLEGLEEGGDHVICIKERAPIFLLKHTERWKWERCFHLQTSFKMDSEHYQGGTCAIYYTLI